MAENKYDLLLVPTKTDRPPKHQPWYKERLRTKLIKTKQATGLDSSGWIFLEDGADDFCSHIPHEDGLEFVTTNEGIPFPVIRSSTSVMPDDGSKRVQPKAGRRRLSKESAVFSKTLPGMQRQRDRVNAVENSLTSYPLRLYPHLEEALPSELFDEVVDILDPDIDESDDNSATRSETSSLKENDEVVKEDPPLLVVPSSTHLLSASDEKKTSDIGTVKRPSYRWRPQSTTNLQGSGGNNGNTKGTKDASDVQPSPSETRVQAVTREFCQWVKNLGESSQSIDDETTVQSLFATGYETKPALSVPIHVVELMNVPAELRLNKLGTSRSSQQVSDEQSLSPSLETGGKDQGDESPYVPSWAERGRQYGAWYLPKRLWEQRCHGGQLEDPKEAEKKAMSKLKRMEAMDTVVGPLHGAQAFKEFIHIKNKRMPRMLSSLVNEEDSRLT